MIWVGTMGSGVHEPLANRAWKGAEDDGSEMAHQQED